MFKTGPILVLLRIHPLVQVPFSLRGIVYSRHECCICCSSFVSRVQKYCLCSTSFKPASEYSLDNFCQRSSQVRPTKRCGLETKKELGLQYCIFRHDSKSLCSRPDRFLFCFESILSHGSRFQCEVACTLCISVAYVVLLSFQEYRSIVFVRQASNPHQNTIWIISGLPTVARIFCSYSCQMLRCCRFSQSPDTFGYFGA